MVIFKSSFESKETKWSWSFLKTLKYETQTDNFCWLKSAKILTANKEKTVGRKFW